MYSRIMVTRKVTLLVSWWRIGRNLCAFGLDCQSLELLRLL